ncbi:MAG: tRNA (cytidine(34)-2'-O)-methyltransferase [Deltaproteobacteria bacterium]|nr:tRNA (cytidine(34)-2'-O)-methyltransferase [Deltaproteobacteria bacterium]
MFTVSLIEPQIPPNTGNIARLCGANNIRLEVVGNIGFELTDKRLKRAGLDYWKYVDWEYYPDQKDYFSGLDPMRMHLLTTKSDISYTEKKFKPGDYLLFGSETTGIHPDYLLLFKDRCCTIPMINKNIRSLNLSSAAAVVVYEALRQNRP